MCKKRIVFFFCSVTLFLSSGFVQSKSLTVRCDQSQSVNKALNKAKPGSIIYIQGNCREAVYLSKDDIILDGMGSATLDGSQAEPGAKGVLVIDQARKVTVRNLSVSGGPQHGILVMRGSVVDFINVIAHDNGQNGFFVMQNSAMHLENSIARDNGNYGIGVIQNSSAALRGAIRATGNANSGILFADNAMADAQHADIEAKTNLNGLQFGDNAVLFTTATTTILANENLRDGLFLFNSGTLESAGGGLIEASNNQASGARLIGNASITSPMGAARYLFENNPVGLHFDVQSSGFFVGGLTVRNNAKGINASGANTLTVVSLPENPSIVQDNQGVDVELGFGVRTDFQGVAIGSIECDSTVLSRGTTICTP